MKLALAYAGRRLAIFLAAGVGLAAVWLMVLWVRYS